MDYTSKSNVSPNDRRLWMPFKHRFHLGEVHRLSVGFCHRHIHIVDVLTRRDRYSLIPLRHIKNRCLPKKNIFLTNVIRQACEKFAGINRKGAMFNFGLPGTRILSSSGCRLKRTDDQKSSLHTFQHSAIAAAPEEYPTL